MSRKYQVLINDNTGTDFSKGNIVAVIQDARDIGVQLYANDTGSAFFTLPVDHPALPLINPLVQHYTIQRQNDSGVYETIAGGLISDYDASDQEVVISGVDYMTVLSRYYTPLDGPPTGATAIDTADANVILADANDKLYEDEGFITPTAGVADIEAGQINAYNNPAGAPSVGTKNQITVTQDDATGTIKVEGNLYIVRRKSNTNKVILGNTGYTVGGGPALTAVGLILYSDPGGACALILGSFPDAPPYNEVYVNGTPGGDPVITFRIDLPYFGNGTASNSVPGGVANIGRTSPIVYKGVPYRFAVQPFYVGNFIRYENASNTSNVYYNDVDANSGAANNTASTANGTMNTLNKSAAGVFQHRIWGPKSDFTTASTTSGIKRKSLPDIIADMYPKVLDRTADYADSAGTLPKALIAWQPTVNNVNQGSSTTLHPYITYGQDPVEFFREVAELETSSRGGTIGVKPNKVVFNYFGVPGGTDGQLTFNHNVSATPAHTYVYPGTIKGYNAIHKRSMLANSVRVLPSTDFLVGTSTDAPAGSRSRGVTKSDRSLGYALPHIESQAGFINIAAAQNHAQGILNDRGTVDDTKVLSVSMRTGVVPPIGATGGPRLGECVRLVVRREAVEVGGAGYVESNYNVGGMQLMVHNDGHEEMFFDFVKPTKFKGPGITFANPITAFATRKDTTVPQDKTKKKNNNNNGNGNNDGQIPVPPPVLLPPGIVGPPVHPISGWNPGTVAVIGLPAPATNLMDPRLQGVSGDSLLERMQTFNRLRLAPIQAQLNALNARSNANQVQSLAAQERADRYGLPRNLQGVGLPRIKQE